MSRSHNTVACEPCNQNEPISADDNDDDDDDDDDERPAEDDDEAEDMPESDGAGEAWN